jgi:hypothetical protein
MRTKVPLEIRTCSVCNLTGMAKGDTPFKGIQIDPEVGEVVWFCDKPICKKSMDEAIERATRLWEAHV